MAVESMSQATMTSDYSFAAGGSAFPSLPLPSLPSSSGNVPSRAVATSPSPFPSLASTPGSSRLVTMGAPGSSPLPRHDLASSLPRDSPAHSYTSESSLSHRAGPMLVDFHPSDDEEDQPEFIDTIEPDHMVTVPLHRVSDSPTEHDNGIQSASTPVSPHLSKKQQV